MATWKAEVFQNEYLPDGGTDVHAIVTVSCTDSGQAGSGSTGGAAEVIIVDCSGSMSSPRAKIIAARKAAAAAVNAIDDGTWFGVIAGVGLPQQVYPIRGMVQADDRTRAEATQAVSGLTPSGGTAIGLWLSAARELFAQSPATQRHAILLTDGKNEGESAQALADSVQAATGVFQCDCRGVGADWDVNELRGISTALLGSVDLIANPDDMADDFEAIMRTSMGRGIADARLKIWAPQGSQLLFVKQVSPTIDELTDRRTAVTPLITEYPTGAWGDESRDYHVAVRLGAKPVGSEQLAARVQIDVGGQVVTQALVKALWSDDSGLTTRINPAVAHYTGQAELAGVIQEGLAARAAGDDATATFKLGRAAKLAAETGNDEATSRLKKIVDIEDADHGTVRLKREVNKLDEMALDTASTKTTRVRPT
ncbi:MAG: von Willebrand factor type [Pseudonocardiales bacterium]|nr:von Willebrand factor type [Pseudonocardiales bacterium]